MNRHFLLPLVALSSLTASQLARAEPAIDDRQIKMSFEKQLGTLKDDEKTPSPEAIKQQLVERKRHLLELPEIAAITHDRVGPTPTSRIYRERKQSVLCFGNIYKCDNCNNWHGNIAGGFVITADGVAVTNYHVMENAKAGAFGAMTTDGKVYAVEEVLAASKRDDIAIVKLAGEGFTPAPLTTNAPVGSRVVAVSHPQGRFYTVSEGIISRYYKQGGRGKDSGAERIAITADFAKGSSGCPVFAADGKVVGMVASTNSIYYDRNKDGTESNLQMVIKNCIPSGAILRLLSGDEAPSDKDESNS